jgi:hypothetical protein
MVNIEATAARLRVAFLQRKTTLNVADRARGVSTLTPSTTTAAATADANVLLVFAVVLTPWLVIAVTDRLLVPLADKTVEPDRASPWSDSGTLISRSADHRRGSLKREPHLPARHLGNFVTDPVVADCPHLSGVKDVKAAAARLRVAALERQTAFLPTDRARGVSSWGTNVWAVARVCGGLLPARRQVVKLEA